MLVLLVVAAVAVLYCVVVVSQGRGGEMTEFVPDVPPLNLPEPGQLTAVDFMSLQLPVSLVGYHTQSVDETLQRAATALGERDTHIAVLEQRVAELLAGRLQARQESSARPSWAPGSSPGPAEPPLAHEPPMSLTGSLPVSPTGLPSASGADSAQVSGVDSSRVSGVDSSRVSGGVSTAPADEPPSVAAGDGPVTSAPPSL